jgi:malonyl CoA-acyl carrier protein transacylase
MYRRTFAILMGVLAVAAIAAGCGGGDSSAESLTKAEFVKKANAICARLSGESQAELLAYINKNVKGSGNKALTKGQEEELVESLVVPSVNKQIEELDALGAPEGDEEQIDAFIEELESTVEEAEEETVGFTEERPFAEAEKLAREYGISECGHQ